MYEEIEKGLDNYYNLIELGMDNVVMQEVWMVYD